MHELVCDRDYISEEPMSYWRSTSGFEVDFIVGDHSAIGVKAKQNISPADLKSLKALADEKRLKR
jgi:predicted AAA+ superfamily ATPase